MKTLSLFFFLIAFTSNGFSENSETKIDITISNQSLVKHNTMTVMTLNIAHGRKDSLHQFFLSKNTIKSNLDQVVATIRREQPDIVALQEADGPSFWSGKFNHLEYFINKTELEEYFLGFHVNKYGLHYGTALLAIDELDNSRSHSFSSRSFLSLTKGFVLSTIAWPGDEKLKIDLVSVHLDFLLDSVKQKQINQLVEVMKDRSNPLIVMGDLNADKENDAFNLLVSKLKLKKYKVDEDELSTFPRSNKRVDWILLSDEMDFISYKVLPDILSDHRAVIAEIRISK